MYHLTRDGIQPQTKKVEAILRIAPPKTKCQLRHFLGMVNFYRDVWRRRSHLEAPLTLKQDTQAQVCAAALTNLIKDDSVVIPKASNKEAMTYAFDKTDKKEEQFPLSPALIATEQKLDKTFKKRPSKNLEENLTLE